MRAHALKLHQRVIQNFKNSDAIVCEQSHLHPKFRCSLLDKELYFHRRPWHELGRL